jgi:hypothetical protein
MEFAGGALARQQQHLLSASTGYQPTTAGLARSWVSVCLPALHPAPLLPARFLLLLCCFLLLFPNLCVACCHIERESAPQIPPHAATCQRLRELRVTMLIPQKWATLTVCILSDFPISFGSPAQQ